MIVLGFMASLMVSPNTGVEYKSETEICREVKSVLVERGYNADQLKCEMAEE